MKTFWLYYSVEWEIIRSAPFLFGLASFIVGGLVYVAARWKFSTNIEHLRAEIRTLNERLKQMDTAKSNDEHVPTCDEKVLHIVVSFESERTNVRCVQAILEKMEDFCNKFL